VEKSNFLNGIAVTRHHCQVRNSSWTMFLRGIIHQKLIGGSIAAADQDRGPEAGGMAASTAGEPDDGTGNHRQHQAERDICPGRMKRHCQPPSLFLRGAHPKARSA
jgi:hypothetical protein